MRVDSFLLLQELTSRIFRSNKNQRGPCVQIEFDPAKRETTLAERGLDMARAEEIFAGPTLTVVDDRRDYGETRYVTVGYLDGRMVVMAWTRRSRARRIISLRKANDREQELYAARFR
jgi:uncharacterized DUF497 family protein